RQGRSDSILDRSLKTTAGCRAPMSAYKFRVDQSIDLAPLSQSWTQQGAYKVTLSSRPCSLGNLGADDIIVTDFEVAVLCDLLNSPDASLTAHRRAILDQLSCEGARGACQK